MKLSINTLIRLLVRQRRYLHLLESWVSSLEIELGQRVANGETTNNRALDLTLAVGGRVQYDGIPPVSIRQETGQVLFELEKQMAKHPGELALVEVGPWDPTPEIILMQMPHSPASLRFKWDGDCLVFPATHLAFVYAAHNKKHDKYLQDGYFHSNGLYDIYGGFFTPKNNTPALVKMTVGTRQVIRRLNTLGDWDAYYAILNLWGIDTPVDRLDRIRSGTQPKLFNHELS